MSRPTRVLTLVIVLVGGLEGFAQAQIRLPSVICNHMVLQRDQPVPIWGWGSPGEEVTVRFAGLTKTTTVNDDGRWSVTLPELAANTEPRSMVIEGTAGRAIELTDILVGEVWFCTGPSNIAWTVEKCEDADWEIDHAEFPEIRFFTVGKNDADEPQEDCCGSWCRCSPTTVGGKSGVGYFFCRRIHRDVDVPVGLLGSFWGGTRVEAWTSLEALEAEPALRPILDYWDSSPDDKVEHRPACLYNGMIAPLIPFSIRGVLCYQGLGNLDWADRGFDLAEYSPILLETWIRDCRARWGRNLPVGMVQPAPFNCVKRTADREAYSFQREAQLIVQERLDHLGIALTMDVDDVDQLHPANKQLVGQRLSNWALADVYGFDIPHAGPVYQDMKVEGAAVHIQFRNADAGLSTRDGLRPRHFTVAGSDGEFHSADALIVGSTVIVRSEEVAEPVSARFAFTDTDVVNLTNQYCLPASLFRTDLVD